MFREMLAEGRRLATPDLDVWARSMSRIGCLRPDLDSGLISSLMSDLRGGNTERQDFALGALGDLAEDGHVVDIDDWIPEGLVLLAARDLGWERRDALAKLLTAGTFRPENGRTLADGYQHLVEQARESAEALLRSRRQARRHSPVLSSIHR
jgi:hypothetical protein